MILRALTLAIGQLSDPKLQKVIMWSIGASLLALLCLIWAIGHLLTSLIGVGVFSLPLLGTISLEEVGIVAQIVVGAVLSLFLMVPITQGVQSLLLDRVADAVEAKHYPSLPPDRELPFVELLAEAARGLVLLLGANLIGLVFYILLAPIAPLLFYGLNGFLLGREYFLVAGLRRSDRRDVQRMRRDNRSLIWITGIIMAIGLTIPVLNLLMPTLGAACFTHIYHDIRKRS